MSEDVIWIESNITSVVEVEKRDKRLCYNIEQPK